MRARLREIGKRTILVTAHIVNKRITSYEKTNAELLIGEDITMDFSTLHELGINIMGKDVSCFVSIILSLI